MRFSQGYSVLELLLALAIFSAGLLGILQLQLLAQRQLQDSLYITHAARQAYSLSAWLSAFSATPGSVWADKLTAHWRATHLHLLPASAADLTLTGDQMQITVSWQDLEGRTSCDRENSLCVSLKRR